MEQIAKRLVFFGLLIATAGYGQSLADAARQVRQQKSKNQNAASKVYTSDDLASSNSSTPAPASPDAGSSKIQMTPEEWKRAIAAEKGWIAALQQKADQLKEPPLYQRSEIAQDPKAKAYWENRDMQKQLADLIPGEKEKLARSQEAARKAGLPQDVWDPPAPSIPSEPSASK